MSEGEKSADYLLEVNKAKQTAVAKFEKLALRALTLCEVNPAFLSQSRAENVNRKQEMKGSAGLTFTKDKMSLPGYMT